MSLRRILSLALMLLIGAGLIAFPFATDMFVKANGVDNLTGAFRDSFTEQALGSTTADMATVASMSQEMQNEMLPALPAALGMSPQQFQDFMGQNYPDAAAGITQLDSVVPRFQGLVTGLNQQADNFRQADAIPTSWLPASTVPYLFVVPGAILVVLALAGLLARRSAHRTRLARSAAVVSLLVGLIFVVAPFAMSLPAKAEAVDEMTDSFAATFSEQGASQVRDDLAVMRAMSNELATRTVPELARAMKMSPDQFNEFLGQQFPDVATGMQQIGGILDRFDAFGTAIDANIVNFRLAGAIPTAGTSTTTLLYWFVIPGAALLLLGAIALPTGSRVPDDKAVAEEVPVPA